MTTPKINIALAGPKGRLGSQIQQAISLADDVQLNAMLERNSSLSDLTNSGRQIDLLLDVSSCKGVMQRLPVVLELGLPLIIGVTGFTAEQTAQIEQTARQVPILLCGNFSIGVNQLLVQVKQTAKLFGPEAKVDISETHHLDKKDYPSGTALLLAQAVMDGFDQEKQIKSTLWPQKLKTNSDNTLAITCYRKAGVIGEHAVTFTKDNEQVVLGHTALDREIFANGALIAARWIISQKPGLYDMSAVLK